MRAETSASHGHISFVEKPFVNLTQSGRQETRRDPNRFGVAFRGWDHKPESAVGPKSFTRCDTAASGSLQRPSCEVLPIGKGWERVQRGSFETR